MKELGFYFTYPLYKPKGLNIGENNKANAICAL